MSENWKYNLKVALGAALFVAWCYALMWGVALVQPVAEVLR